MTHPADVRMTVEAGRIETEGGMVQVMFKFTDAIYELPPGTEGFEETLLALFRSWRDGTGVAVTIRGVTIRSATAVG